MSTAPRAAAARLGLALAAAILCAGFLGLGTWQLQRRAWKLDLIARVDSRVHAAPVDAPARADWPAVGAAQFEYRHVRVAGRYLYDRETLVHAATELGSGYWVLTPLQEDDGSVVLVNRGFVPAGTPPRAQPGPSGAAPRLEVTGLLRLSEPGDRFLRRNDPAAQRWRSRDVAAIAAARGLQDVAPFFIDADAAVPGGATGEDGVPVGGLTVIAFRNNHLEYALTWYALAALVLVAARVFRRHGADGTDPEDTAAARAGVLPGALP